MAVADGEGDGLGFGDGVGDFTFEFVVAFELKRVFDPLKLKFESKPRFVLIKTFALALFALPASDPRESPREIAQNPNPPTTRSASVPKMVSTTTFTVFDFGGG